MEHLHDKIRIKFGLAISQLVDVVGVHVIVCSISHSCVGVVTLWNLGVQDGHAVFPDLLLPSGSFTCCRDRAGVGALQSAKLFILPSSAPTDCRDPRYSRNVGCANFTMLP